MRELRAGANFELPVDARQSRLDRPHGEEERSCNLTVRVTFADERGDAALGLGQVVGARATADARELGACLLGPQRDAESLEASERVFERGAGGAAFLGASLGLAEREQGAGMLEGIDCSGVLGERSLEAREGAFEVASCGELEAATAAENRERPGPIQGPRARLPVFEDRFRLRELTGRISASSRSPSSKRMPGSVKPRSSRSAAVRFR
jgi:hypothetical protein